MKKIILAAAALMLSTAAVASAQNPTTPPRDTTTQKMPQHDQGAMDTTMKRGQQVAAVDVNTATQQQLESIPALKPYADKIIKGRPYTSVDQLEEKNILPKDVYTSTKTQLKVGGGNSSGSNY